MRDDMPKPRPKQQIEPLSTSYRSDDKYPTWFSIISASVVCGTLGAAIMWCVQSNMCGG